MALPSLWNWGRGREVPIRRGETSLPMGEEAQSQAVHIPVITA